MGARLRKPSEALVRIGKGHRDQIQASMILKRLNAFCLCDPDNPRPGDIRMTRTQVHVALALLRKILPDLASVEVSGNPDKPLAIQVVRFTDGLTIDMAPNPLQTLAQPEPSIPVENASDGDKTS